MILFSVIIPHYNSLEVLPRAVKSIPEREDIEILIVDNSAKPISSTFFKDRKNAHILYSKYGKGAGAARNVGLEHAKGKWVLFLDADDFFMPNAFDICYKYVHTNADIIYFYATSCISETMQPSNRMEDTNQLITQYMLTGDDRGLRYYWSSPCSKMIRRDLITTNTISFEERHAANDMIFSLLIGYYASKLDASKETIYCATVCEGSLTQSPTLNNIKDRIDASIQYNKFVKEHNLARYQKSIMYYLFTTYKNYGFIPMIRLLGHSIRMGNNPFIGMSRWVHTAKKIKICK